MKNKLLLIDGNSVAFRAFYALHNSLDRFKNNNGLHTNAIYAFHTMFDNMMARENPTHVLVAFDAGRTTFRHEWYDEYKGGRSKTPSEFKEQMPYIRELINALGVEHYELDNYEADDIIGTLAKQVDKEKFDVVVLTGDRDLTQLVTDDVTVNITLKGVSEVEVCTPEFIAEKYQGLSPLQIIDLKGLAGDASDNIPGVTKVGEKTAIKLLNEFGSIEGIYEHIDSLKKSKMKENLINDKEQAFLSKKLATIHTDSPITVQVEDLKYEGKDLEKLIPFYKEMNFNTFLEKLNIVEEVAELEAIDFEVVTQTTDEMFQDESALYVEMLSENYHVGEIVGLVWGTKEKVYVSKDLAILEQTPFKNWLEDASKKKHVYDAKRTIVALSKEGVQLKGCTFDILLAAYLLNTNDQSNDISAVAHHYGYDAIHSDTMIYGKGAKIAVPEDDVLFEHLARKVVAIEWLSTQLVTELKEKEQVSLFYEIELPL
ncbi:MAG TPA: DNA polymerase I, partial [Candidatus Enterococcus avicola]|nr:DNA polymerase I [Candidatus Enterococcus avicola]